MKKIFLILLFSGVSHLINAQSMNINQWFIHSISNLIDSNGKSYTLVDIHNTDTIVQVPDMISIAGLISNSDTINTGFVNWLYWTSIQSDTTVTLRIDTVVAQNQLTGILIQRGQAGCGMWIIDSLYVQKMCDGFISLGIDEEVVHNFTVYPNPTKTILHITTKQNTVIKNIIVRNSQGQVVLSKICNNTLAEKIDIHKFSKGIYLLSVNNTTSQKIEIE